ncbi:MAG: DUF502 domain-containing protein [Candidatus Babeliales bacterium]|nr:DUF502 domain-containing protein [Candidatus Babeliales bacterium]
MKQSYHKLLNEIKSIFLSGLFTILPLTLTLILFKASFNLIRGWISPISRIEPKFLRNVAYSEFILVILFIFIIGIILKFFVLKRLIHFIEEKFFYKVPLLRSVYSGIKQLVHALTQQDQLSFNKVVLVEFPTPGTYSIGFLTGEFLSVIPSQESIIHYNVFIPTTPNPTTGFFVIVPKEKFSEIDLSRQEAMAIIISGGIIKPDRFNKV